MSVKFAPARHAATSPIAKCLTRASTGPAANDHDGGMFMSDTTQQALRHFAEHGLRAGAVALDNAARAEMAACDADYAYWLGICGELDPAAAERFVSARSDEASRLIG